MSKTFKAIACAAVLLFLAEALLQVRSQVRYGASVFNTLSGETTYQYNESLALKLLRPSATITGSKAVIVTNSLGLRSPEVKQERIAGIARIAVLGASSVMGTYTRDNEETIPYRLQNYLKTKLSVNDIEVINAGIAGHGLKDQAKMLQNVIKPLSPDLVVWYPGFNDISGYCKRESLRKKNNWSLPKLSLPSWLLSIELLTKNTVFLRTIKAKKENRLLLEDIDTTNYKNNIDQIISYASNNNIPLILVTNARAFREDMPVEKQLKLSETARYYTNCFDLPTLHKVYNHHNQILKGKIIQAEQKIMPLDSTIPGGSKYFSDATHFSSLGSDFFAEHLANMIVEQSLLYSAAKGE